MNVQIINGLPFIDVTYTLCGQKINILSLLSTSQLETSISAHKFDYLYHSNNPKCIIGKDKFGHNLVKVTNATIRIGSNCITNQTVKITDNHMITDAIIGMDILSKSNFQIYGVNSQLFISLDFD